MVTTMVEGDFRTPPPEPFYLALRISHLSLGVRLLFFLLPLF